MKLKLGKKEYLFFPKISILYLAIFLCLIIILAFILEYFLLPQLKNKSILGCSKKWKQENMLINMNNYYKRDFVLTTFPLNCNWSKETILAENDTASVSNICSSSDDLFYNNPSFINDFIWRDNIYNVSPQKITSKRILVVGDSYEWGDGFANMNDIWWRKLQRELVKKGYYDLEVIAFGWCDFTTRDEFERLKAVVRIYKPDIIVWGYVTNDADEGVIKAQDPSDYDFNNMGIVNIDFILLILNKLNYFLPDLIKNFYKARINKLSGHWDKSENPGIVYGYSNWELALLKGRNFEKYNQTLHEINLFSQKNSNIPIFFVTLPNVPSRNYYEPRYNKIIKAFKSNNLKLYNLFPELLKEFPNQLCGENWGINPANGHPGVISTDFYARQVTTILEKDYPKYLPKKYAGHAPKEQFINDWVPINIDIKQSANSIEFEYPTNNYNFLSMPYGYKYIQFNLSYPKAVKGIILKGTNLSSARLDITYEKPTDSKIYQLGLKRGKEIYFRNINSGKLLNTIRISANFSTGRDRKLGLKIVQ